jgi:hypothetical protein
VKLDDLAIEAAKDAVGVVDSGDASLDKIVRTAVSAYNKETTKLRTLKQLFAIGRKWVILYLWEQHRQQKPKLTARIGWFDGHFFRDFDDEEMEFKVSQFYGWLPLPEPEESPDE